MTRRTGGETKSEAAEGKKGRKETAARRAFIPGDRLLLNGQRSSSLAPPWSKRKRKEFSDRTFHIKSPTTLKNKQNPFTVNFI